MEFVESKSTGIFAIHRDLDGEIHSGEFQEREQFIGLIIGQEEFLLPISTVREIIMLSPITYVPNSPEFIDGVINLRGNILPVINMRKVMRIGRGTGEGSVRVIIARYEGITFGLLVDGITYVVSLLPQEIENQSLPGKGTGAEFIGSISKHGNKVAGILDLVRIIKAVAGDALDGDSEESSTSEH